jgi:hypothetical protein
MESSRSALAIAAIMPTGAKRRPVLDPGTRGRCRQSPTPWLKPRACPHSHPGRVLSGVHANTLLTCVSRETGPGDLMPSRPSPKETFGYDTVSVPATLDRPVRCHPDICWRGRDPDQRALEAVSLRECALTRTPIIPLLGHLSLTGKGAPRRCRSPSPRGDPIPPHG